MSDDDYKDLVTKHDKHIDSMASSIEHLAKAVGTTNSKLEDMIAVINTQNVLMEKFSNMETNLKESFNRVHLKIKDIEEIHKNKGCSSVMLISEKVTVANKRIADLENIGKWIMRLVISAIILALLGLVLNVKG